MRMTNEIKVLRSGDAYYPSNDAKASSTVTTDEGKIYIRGLKPGTYKLTETKTKRRLCTSERSSSDCDY